MNSDAHQDTPRVAPLRRLKGLVMWISVGWGLLMLGVGYLASFGMDSHETLRSMAGLAIVFILPLIASVVAWRRMRIVGIALLLSVPLAFLCIAESWSDVAQVASKVYLWPHLIFGLLFLLLGRIR